MIIKNILKKIVRFIRLVKASDDFIHLKYGKNLIVGPNTLIYPSKFIQFGNNTSIGRNVTISTSESGRSPIKIGSFSRLDIPMEQQGEGKQGAIEIEDDVWIGTGSIILGGIKIGKGSIVGAGSVVTKSVEPYSIVAGNPSKLIRKRK